MDATRKKAIKGENHNGGTNFMRLYSGLDAIEWETIKRAFAASPG